MDRLEFRHKLFRVAHEGYGTTKHSVDGNHELALNVAISAVIRELGELSSSDLALVLGKRDDGDTQS